MSKEIDIFVEYVNNFCSENGFTIKLIPEEVVKISEDIKCSGYFDSKNKLLVVATKRPPHIFLGVLAHEFSHLQQYIDKHPFFLQKTSPDEVFDLWVEGVIEYTNISDIIEDIKQVELDCEKRAVDFIDKFKLPINKEEYIRMSNAYVLAHNLMLDKRTFIKNRVSVLANDIRIPSVFLDNYNTREYDHILEILF